MMCKTFAMENKKLILEYMSVDSDDNVVVVLFLYYMYIEHVLEAMCCIQVLGPW